MTGGTLPPTLRRQLAVDPTAAIAAWLARDRPIDPDAWSERSGFTDGAHVLIVDLAQREGMSTQELKRSLEQIARSSVRATHTVNQLLSLARAEGGGTGLQRAPCDLVSLVIEVMQDLLPQAMERHVDMGYEGAEPGDPGVWLQGNATLLKELVRNLLSNAINYSPSSAEHPAVVTARVLPDVLARVVLLQVEDTGPGVPQEERDLVFQPFYRALGSEADGSGLGLPIVQEIARQHGAEVVLSDAQPQRKPPGALFSVRFNAIRSAASIEATDVD